MDEDTAAAGPADEFADTLDLELIKPVTVGKETYRTLHLVEPTMAQLRAAVKAGTTNLDQLAHLIAAVANVLPAVVDKLCKRDIDRAGAFFDRFERKPPTTP
jgi:hypothetical protein